MKIAVLGASRGVGLALVKLALEQNHQVTALLRDPSKLTLQHPNLSIVRGSITDPAAAAQAVAGQDAVAICIGIAPTRQPVKVFSEGAQCVINAIGNSSNTKLIAVSGIGAGDSKGHGGFLYEKIFNPLLLKTIYADKDRMEDLIRGWSGQWLIARPGFLTNGEHTGHYRVINDLNGITAGKISRADVADFILQQAANPTQFGKTPLLMY